MKASISQKKAANAHTRNMHPMNRTGVESRRDKSVELKYAVGIIFIAAGGQKRLGAPRK